MDTVGNFTEYMSMANDYASCIEGESIYFSMNETQLNSNQAHDNSDEDENNTISEVDATKVGDTTLQNEEIPVRNEVPLNENFMSSTPNKLPTKPDYGKLFNISSVGNKSEVDGFLEASKILRQISTKLNAIQNKENAITNTNPLKNNCVDDAIKKSALKSSSKQSAKNIIPPKSTVKITIPNQLSMPNDKKIVDKTKLTNPTTAIAKRQTILSVYAVQNRRKTFIPSLADRADSKEINKEPVTTQKATVKTEQVKKEYLLRKSIIPKSVASVTKTLNSSLKNKQVSSALKVNTRSSIAANSNNRKSMGIRATAVGKLQTHIAKETTNFECITCKRKFRVQSNYLTHMNTHKTTTVSDFVCKFCDKKFQLPLALQNHLLENCTKISSSEKRMMLANRDQATPNTKNNSKTTSMESLSKISNCSSNSATSDSSMRPPSGPSQNLLFNPSKTINLKTLHSGVYRTPKKTLMCNKCGKRFYNIFTLQAHKTCARSDDDEAEE